MILSLINGIGSNPKTLKENLYKSKKKKKIQSGQTDNGKPDNRTDNPRPKKRPNNKQNPQEEGTSLVKKEQARGDQAGS